MLLWQSELHALQKATIGGKNIIGSWMAQVLSSVWDLRDLLILLVHVPGVIWGFFHFVLFWVCLF